MMIVPQAVYDAEEIGAEEIGPAALGTGEPSPLEAAPGDAASPPPDPSAGDAQQRRPCPMCGEMIVATAAKCRFCGAIFDPALKKEEERKRTKDADADLTTGDWIFCILCGWIGCIVGIVYMIRGKPKGAKMIGVSLVATVVWSMLRAVLVQSVHRPGHGF